MRLKNFAGIFARWVLTPGILSLLLIPAVTRLPGEPPAGSHGLDPAVTEVRLLTELADLKSAATEESESEPVEVEIPLSLVQWGNANARANLLGSGVAQLFEQRLFVSVIGDWAIGDWAIGDWATKSFTDMISPQHQIQNDAPIPLLSPTALMALSHPNPHQTLQTVIIDPGHGGSDPGTIGQYGLVEKELTLDIAQRVRALLLPHPSIRVRLTRSEDQGFSRADRVKRIKSMQGDLLVSLHLNNLPQRELTVVESFYAARENIRESELEQLAKQRANFVKTKSREAQRYSYADKSRRLASILQEKVFSRVSADNASAINAGVKKDTLYTLTRSAMPGALIEMTCLSNKQEEERLNSVNYRHKIAESIAEGLLEYTASLRASENTENLDSTEGENKVSVESVASTIPGEPATDTSASPATVEKI